MKKIISFPSIVSLLFLSLFTVKIFAQNIGIDTNNPKEKLDVNGNVNIAGKIKFAGNGGLPGQILAIDAAGNPFWVNQSDLAAITANTLQNVAPFDIGIAAYHSFYDTDPDVVHEGVTLKKTKIRSNINEFDRVTSTEFFMANEKGNPNAFKGPNNIDFQNINKAIALARSLGKKVHGHTLFFNGYFPNWLMFIVKDEAKTKSARKLEFETQIKFYITQVVSQKQAESYDIANELFAFNNNIPYPQDIDGSYYIGVSKYHDQEKAINDLYANDDDFLNFIVSCFVTAHIADPSAVLFYNESTPERLYKVTAGGILSYAKANAMKRLAIKLKNSGIPINKLGLGLQCHTNIDKDINHLKNALNILASTGLKIHISELDISVNITEPTPEQIQNGNDGTPKGIQSLTADLKTKQKEHIKAVVQAYKEKVPVAQAFGITVWDICDGLSWKKTRPDWPTLYDNNFDKKPAYQGFLEGLKE